MKRNEPGVYTFPHTSTNSQIPTVEVACFVVSQITPCISEALLSFHWMRSRFISSIQKLIKLFQKISFIPCQFNWPILIADSGCAFVIENRFLSQSSKLIWSEFVFNIYTVTGQPIFIENIFSRILSVPERRTSKQIRDWSELFRNEFSYRLWLVFFYFFANLFGATKIPMGVLRLGTLRIREKIISIEMGCPVTLYKSSRYKIQSRY